MIRPPKRTAPGMQEGAPEYILACYDAGPEVNDRYTVVFGGSLWEPAMGHSLHYLGFNSCPTSPNMGVSMWGELKCRPRPHELGQRIPWLQIPEDLRQHVIWRAESE